MEKNKKIDQPICDLFKNIVGLNSLVQINSCNVVLIMFRLYTRRIVTNGNIPCCHQIKACIYRSKISRHVNLISGKFFLSNISYGVIVANHVFRNHVWTKVRLLCRTEILDMKPKQPSEVGFWTKFVRAHTIVTDRRIFHKYFPLLMLCLADLFWFPGKIITI